MPPDFVVGVPSAGTKAYDLITRRDDYDRFGVPEHSAVDPSDASVRCRRRQGSLLVEVATAGDDAPSSTIAGFIRGLRPLRRFDEP